jgi:hypothetical protein
VNLDLPGAVVGDDRILADRRLEGGKHAVGMEPPVRSWRRRPEMRREPVFESAEKARDDEVHGQINGAKTDL